MRNRHLTHYLIGLIAFLAPIPNALALDDSGAKAVVSRFIGSQKVEGMDASARQHLIADLNNDGKPDIVLLWDLLGPTFGYSRMSVFIDQGKNYRTLTADLPGQVDAISVKGSNILVDTKVPGPNDPRCCPSVKKRVTYQWTGAKLVMLK